MPKLSSAQRAALPKSAFGLPGSRKYPMPDREHAALAESYATKNMRAGKLSPSAASKIRAKAQRILAQ